MGWLFGLVMISDFKAYYFEVILWLLFEIRFGMLGVCLCLLFAL